MARRVVPLFFLLFFLLSACDQLEGAGAAVPGARPTGSFGVSADYGGPYLNDAEGAVTGAEDERVVAVEPGGRFFVRLTYSAPSGVTGFEVSVTNSSPEGLAGVLDPAQSFFTLGEPTGISEPSGCELTGDPANSPTRVTCIYEVQVAEEAVNLTELEGGGWVRLHVQRHRH